jgi:hypothetical protein
LRSLLQFRLDLMPPDVLYLFPFSGEVKNSRKGS